jgi:RNA-directed DNA polymerase
MVSALVNGVTGGKWFSLVDKVIRPTTLDLAWRKVARNRGAAGVDGQSIERFTAHAERYLQELRDDLKDGSYRPNPVKRVEIPKGDGGKRPLGIPTVKDRIVQTALKMVIEPILEVQFRPGSYGFRPGRSCKDALREVDRLLKAGYTHVVDADLKGYLRVKPGGMLRHDPARPADGFGGGIDQRWERAVADRGLPPAGHHDRHGALATNDGDASRGGRLAAAGQPLSASARLADGAGRRADGAIRR